MSTFNLPAPPGFRGLDPDRPIRRYQRHLPHWRQDGATYFVTFRLADALPKEKLDFLHRLRVEWERSHSPPRTEDDWREFARQYTNQAEHWMDAGHGACWFRQARWQNELVERLLHFQHERHLTSCYVVMPNHCHAVIQPWQGHELEDLLQGIKSLTTKAIHRKQGTSGSLWMQESFDRIIRDEEHLWRVIQYIGGNPGKAGLTPEQAPRWIAPEWQAHGWRFVDP